jgi:uncharacterized protein (DUF302 family)
MAMTEYGYRVEVSDGYDEAVVRTRLALRAEGFSILTEMHVGGLLGPQSGNERQYLIMGAWGPTTSEEPTSDGLQVAVHLPCNLVIQESGTSAIVAALDPTEEVGGEMPDAPQVAERAQAALGRVLERIGRS